MHKGFILTSYAHLYYCCASPSRFTLAEKSLYVCSFLWASPQCPMRLYGECNFLLIRKDFIEKSNMHCVSIFAHVRFNITDWLQLFYGRKSNWDGVDYYPVHSREVNKHLKDDKNRNLNTTLLLKCQADK